MACRRTCPSTTTFLCSACSSCARNPALYLKHCPLHPSSPALGIDGAGKASLTEMPGTLQLSHLSEGTLSFRYQNPKPLMAVFICQNWKPVVPFHAFSLAPVRHCSFFSATSAEPLVSRALPKSRQNPGLTEDHTIREHLIPQKAPKLFFVFSGL